MVMFRSNTLCQTYKTTGPILSPLLPSVFSRDKPAASRKIHMPGKVFEEKVVSYVFICTDVYRLTSKVKVLRPLVSMRNKVGMVATT
jgi:hypothetical protein